MDTELNYLITNKMKQITPETKARIFALYWGQPIINAEGLTKLKRMDELNPLREGDFLVVKPLSSITDEDAIEVVIICEGYAPDNILFRDKTGDSRFSPLKWKQVYYRNHEDEEVIVANFSDTKDGVDVCNGNEYWRCHVAALDYLRSKGYALPAFGYSVDELVEAGVFKIKEVNND